MSDNLSTWPEIIYKPNVNYANYDRQEDVFRIDRDDIAYIRVDIAKEREEKLINAFYELQEAEFGMQKWTKDDVYEIARLEELK